MPVLDPSLQRNLFESLTPILLALLFLCPGVVYPLTFSSLPLVAVGRPVQCATAPPPLTLFS